MSILIIGLNVTNTMSRDSVVESSDDENEGLVMKPSSPKVTFSENVGPA